MMTGKIKLPIVAAGVVATALLFSAPASADRGFLSSTVVVNYQDVDLSTPKGRQLLDRRVDAAISSMCGQPIFGTRDEAEMLDACRVEARSAVTPQLQQAKSRANLNMASVR